MIYKDGYETTNHSLNWIYHNFLYFQLHCCGLFSGQDYAFKHMPIPDSCLSVEGSSVTTHQIGCLDAHWKSHINMTRRQQFFYWALLAAEVNPLKFTQNFEMFFNYSILLLFWTTTLFQSFTLLYSIVFCVLIHRRRHHRSANNLDDVREVIIQQNNIGSRQRLLWSNDCRLDSMASWPVSSLI